MFFMDDFCSLGYFEPYLQYFVALFERLRHLDLSTIVLKLDQCKMILK